MSGLGVPLPAAPSPDDRDQLLREVGALSDRLRTEMRRQSRVALRVVGATALFVGIVQPLVNGFLFRNPLQLTPWYLAISSILVGAGALFVWSPPPFVRWQIARRDSFRSRWRKIPARPVTPVGDLAGAQSSLRWAQMDLDELQQIRVGLLVLVLIVALAVGIGGPMVGWTILRHAGPSPIYLFAFVFGILAAILGAIALVMSTLRWTAESAGLASSLGTLLARVNWVQQATGASR